MCRYRGKELDSNLFFAIYLNIFLRIIAHAIRSLYLERNQIPLKVRVDVFKSVVLPHLFFSGVFIQTFAAKNVHL